MIRREFLHLGAGICALPWRAGALQIQQSGTQPSSTEEGPDPIPEPQFPSRLHQFVWRNWELANTDRMAKVIGTTPEIVLALGSSMGLPKKRHLTNDQLARFYITVIRQNWHVLPKSQIIELLGWDRTKFDFTLKEDDALDIKLGNLKPRCAALVYRPASDAEKAAAAEIRRMIGEDFGKTIERPGEDLFAFVKDLSESRYLPARDPAGKAGGDEIDLSRGWSISAPGNLGCRGSPFRRAI